MKKLIVLCALLTVLAGCSASPEALPSPAPSSSSRWTPPDTLLLDLSEEAQSALEALELCRSFVREMNARYPDYAPSLSSEDFSYYSDRLRDPDADVASLSSELAGTIVALRQQVYLRMEETTKVYKLLPDGLEEYVRSFEAQFQEIGW